MKILAIEAWHEGTHLGRLEGFRMIVDMLGGKLENVQATPAFDDGTWHLEIAVVIPPEKQERCTQIAIEQFDGQVNVMTVGTREEAVTPSQPPK